MRNLFIAIICFATLCGCTPEEADAQSIALRRARRTAARQVTQNQRQRGRVDVDVNRFARGVNVDIDRFGRGARGFDDGFGGNIDLSRRLVEVNSNGNNIDIRRRVSRGNSGGQCNNGFDNQRNFNRSNISRGNGNARAEVLLSSGLDIGTILKLLALQQIIQTPAQVIDIPIEREIIEFVPQIRREIINQQIVIPGQTFFGGY